MFTSPFSRKGVILGAGVAPQRRALDCLRQQSRRAATGSISSPACSMPEWEYRLVASLFGAHTIDPLVGVRRPRYPGQGRSASAFGEGIG